MTNLLKEFADALDEAVAEDERRSGYPVSEWKIGGRKSKDKPAGENLDWWRAEGPVLLATYENWLRENSIRIASIEGVPAIEYGGAVAFPSGAVVKGYIDLVVEVGDSLMVVDLKSGSRVPPGHGQLALYATMLELLAGDRPTVGGYYMIRKGILTPPEDLSPWGVDYFDAVTQQLLAAYRESIFIPKVDTHCVACGVAQFCHAVRGVNADKYDTLANPSLPPLTEEDFPPHLSWSQISSWLWCGKQAELSRLRRADDKPAVYLAAGSALHTIAEQIALRHFEAQA